MWQASNFEFKYRFWIIGALFFLAFYSYNVDRQNAGVSVVDWLAHTRGAIPAHWEYRAIFAIGAFICLASAALRTWATAYLKAEVMFDMHMHTSHVVADGPYRYLRNPLYLGNILLAIGFGVLASRSGFFILVLGMIGFVYRLILREEGGLRASQGPAYLAYCQAVPRLLPALRPKLPSGGRTPNWKDGLIGEAFMWILALAVVTFAITLDQRIYFIVLVSAFAVYAICYTVTVRRQRKTANVPQSSAERPPETHGQSNSTL